MSETIMKQTMIMLILIIAGVICAKTKIISRETNKDLSKFVLQVVNPVTIFMSYQKDYETRLVKNLLTAFALSVLAFAVIILCAYLLIRKKEKRDAEVERFASIYSNCGFMGIPLMNALFGSEGVFYLTAYLTVFNLIVWTHGVIMISGEKNFKSVTKVFYSPTIISILLGLITFFCRIRLPEIASSALSYIEHINTPLAMIVAGVTISSSDIPNMLKNYRIYYVSAVKLLIIPIVLSFVLSPISVDEKVRMTVLVAGSAPPASMGTLFCIKYGKNSLYASELFTAGTLLSVLTLPIVVKFTESLTNLFT